MVGKIIKSTAICSGVLLWLRLLLTVSLSRFTCIYPEYPRLNV